MFNSKLFYFCVLIPFVSFGFENTKIKIVSLDIVLPHIDSKLSFDSFKQEDMKKIKPFFIQKYEVSKVEFFPFAEKLANKNKIIENIESSLWLDKYSYYDEDEELIPVTKISFDMANKYCKSIKGRVPTELEWVIAAKTDKEVIVNDDYLNSVDMSIKTSNGLYGIYGNVWEMTSSKYENQDDKIIIKGGSYQNTQTPQFFNPRFRNFINKTSLNHEYEHIGFRCVFDK